MYIYIYIFINNFINIHTNIHSDIFIDEHQYIYSGEMLYKLDNQIISSIVCNDNRDNRVKEAKHLSFNLN